MGLDRARRVVNRMSWIQIDDLLDNIGSLIDNRVKARIVEEKREPSGHPWKPLSKNYAAWKAVKRPGIGMLEFDGHLRDSITYVVGTGKVDIGSNLVYANYQNSIRPFLGVSSDDRDEIEDLTVNWLESRMGIKL
jgi:phage gpG-like protein